MSDDPNKRPGDEEVAALVAEGLPEEIASLTFSELLEASAPDGRALMERAQALVAGVRIDLDEPLPDEDDSDE